MRSLLFQTYFFASVAVAATGVVLTAPFPGNGPFRITRGWCRGMMVVGKHVCGLDYVIEGAEHIPTSPSVVMIKHASVFEAYAQVVVFPQQVWVLKRELFWIPFFGWGLLALKPIAINRKAGRTAVKQVIEQGKKRLAAGLWVTVFPEGTRMPPGETRKYGVSGAALAQAANVKIVPVAHNAGDFWPRRGFSKTPRAHSLLYRSADRRLSAKPERDERAGSDLDRIQNGGNQRRVSQIESPLATPSLSRS